MKLVHLNARRPRTLLSIVMPSFPTAALVLPPPPFVRWNAGPFPLLLATPYTTPEVGRLVWFRSLAPWGVSLVALCRPPHQVREPGPPGLFHSRFLVG